MEKIPIVILGCAFTIPGDKISFQYGTDIEVLELCEGIWTYTHAGRTIIVDHDEMDTILIGWYTMFDHSSNGMCHITIRVIKDGDVTELSYKN